MNIILIAVLAIITFEFGLEMLLNYLNISSLSASLPSELEGLYEADAYKKSQDYTKAKTSFGVFSSVFQFLLTVTVMYLGILGKVSDELAKYIANPTLLSLAYFGILFIVSDVLSIPFQWYGTFVIEEKFGFNKTTTVTFITDKLKGYALGAIIGGLVLGILFYLINTLGENFWIYFWVVIAVLMLLINMFYTSLFLPLFNKLTPLEEGELKNAITEYSKKVGFSLENVFVLDGSKRSGKANAFFSGIGPKKKVVLYDTLITQHTTDELMAVLAHEVGHFKKKHIISSYIIGVLQIGVMLFVLSKVVLNQELSIAMGAEKYAIQLNLIVFSLLYSPISTITGLIMNIFSRKNEYEADAYAATTYSGEALSSALKKLSVNNLSNLTPHPWVVFFEYSHPTLLQRLNAMKKIG